MPSHPPTVMCPAEHLAFKARLLAEKLLITSNADTRDYLDNFERSASHVQARSATGALYQVGLAFQDTDKIGVDDMDWFGQESLRELRRHLLSVSTYLVMNGADPEKAQTRCFMPHHESEPELLGY